MYATGRIKEAGKSKSLLNIVNTIDQEVYMNGPITTWVLVSHTLPAPSSCIQNFTIDFAQRCLSIQESSRYKPLLTIPYTTPERVGKTEIDRQFVDRCLGCHY